MMDYTVIIERGQDGYYISEVAELPGCHTQGKTVDELMERTKEAIECYLEGEGEDDGKSIVLPVHAGEKIDRSLLKKIIKKDLKMTTEEFLGLIE
jgi:predicted RNase H-like HicB family nuclease